MRKGLENEIKVGLFVTVGLALIMVSILVLGQNTSLFSSTNHYMAFFDSVEGLIPGAKITVGGIQVGTVDKIGFDQEKRDVRVDFKVEKKFEEWLRKDSTIEIATQGVLGDKYIIVTEGSPDQPQLPSGSSVSVHKGKDLKEFLSSSDQLLGTLNTIASGINRLIGDLEKNHRSDKLFEGAAETAKNLSQVSDKLNRELDHIQIKATLRNLNSILEKINGGTGTLGALVNDPALYDDAKSLVGGVNKNRIIRNLVRETIKKSEDDEGKKK